MNRFLRLFVVIYLVTLYLQTQAKSELTTQQVSAERQISTKAGIEDKKMNVISVIPRPAKIKLTEGVFTITPETTIIVNNDTRSVGQYLARLLAPAAGSSLEIKESSASKAKANCIVMLIDSSLDHLGPEGYQLKVARDKILVNATSPAGIFYACQTFRQLLPAAIEDKNKIQGIALTIPCVEIEDKPRYQWRGMHLDVCRHFFSKDFVKRYIDMLALHKMNRFHWHLTEDQGWRIEIKKYPKLTQISAWRKGESGSKYGGFYTPDDIRQIVEYAKQQFITVVPEIEMPGHSVAALAAYPQFSCSGGPFEVETRWGGFRDVYCAGNDATFEFLQDVLCEVIDLFPSQYLHIGGDECLKDAWKNCPKCQARIKAEGLKDEYELQSYFIKRISKFLKSKNKKLIGWDEILEGGLAEDAIVMSWRGTEGGITAARGGHDVVMSPTTHCYFDHYQADPNTQPKAWGGLTTLEKVYSFEPTPPELTSEQAKHIIGAQANVWTEYIETEDYLEYMVFPRMCALAEVVWSPKELRDWDDFKERLKAHSRRLDELDINFYRTPSIWGDQQDKTTK